VLWDGDGQDLPARSEISHFDLRHAATRHVVEQRGNSARVQPAGSRGDTEKLLCESRRQRPAIMIIAQISDTHLTLDTPDADRRIHDFASTSADINALDPAPDVIIHTGDIVHNGRADEYARAATILAAARAPVYVLPGNRDDRRNLRA